MWGFSFPIFLSKCCVIYDPRFPWRRSEMCFSDQSATFDRCTHISPPHTQVHYRSISVSESVQPVLPTCSPLLDWDPMRTCVCVAVSRHISSFTVFPAHTGQHQWALTKNPRIPAHFIWRDPSRARRLSTEQRWRSQREVCLDVPVGEVCVRNNPVWEWVCFQSDPGVGSLFAHVNSVIVDETIALLLPWPSHFLQPC